MNDKIYIVSGTYEEYKNWVRKNIDRLYKENNSLSLSNFIFVSNADMLRGHREVHGYYTGSYKNRPDIEEIRESIRIINGR